MRANVTIALILGLQALRRRHCSFKVRILVRRFSTRSRLTDFAGDSTNFPHSTALDRIDLSVSSSRFTVLMGIYIRYTPL